MAADIAAETPAGTRPTLTPSASGMTCVRHVVITPEMLATVIKPASNADDAAPRHCRVQNRFLRFYRGHIRETAVGTLEVVQERKISENFLFLSFSFLFT